MMAAISAAESGHHVMLLEKNEKLGKKLFITGKGRCNVTNDSEVDNLLRHTVRNPKFLYSAYYTFPGQSMMAFLEQEGLPLKTERGNRVFPVSDRSSDVIRTLQRALEKRGVRIFLHTEVNGLITENGCCCGVVCHIGKKREVYRADAVVLATGGLSYPSTGSTGDGYRMAEQTGHRLSQCSPSLVPFVIREDWVKTLQGLSLRNVSLRLESAKKVLYEEQGEMLFTHFGISGPLVLSASSYAAGRDTELTAVLDMKPALSAQQLDDRILRDFADCRNGFFRNSLNKLLPAKMIPVVIKCSGIPPEKRVHDVTRQERQRLVQVLKGLTMTVAGLRGYQEAIITRGGVDVRDVNPGTMESRKLPGLFFAGEVLDADAVTGGYNLQIAWSTGYLAGLSIQ